MADDRSIQDEIAQKKQSMDEGARGLAEDNAKKAFLAAKKQADELRSAAIADEIDKIKKDAVERYDKKGNPITKQAIFEDKLKSVMGSEQSSIHDWKSSMMALISVLAAFVAAVNQEVNEKTAPYLVPLKHALKNGVIDMKDTLLDKLRGDPRVDLPTLVHDVKIGDDNKLAVNLRADEQQLNEQEKLPQGLRTLVALWLNERGYEIDPNNEEGFRSKEGHEPLTAEVFNELKNDPDNGLNEFLNRASEVQYREELEDDGPSPH
ncbi:MAG: hypothetical protein P4L79_08185 [Legionella sp.]|uniref:hypothetical protein n=1 Tax=Legionella sp. TaxID=459 RepID=UPI00284BFE71|nr:hypothetical protein [Legionella sp.]